MEKEEHSSPEEESFLSALLPGNLCQHRLITHLGTVKFQESNLNNAKDKGEKTQDKYETT